MEHPFDKLTVRSGKLFLQENSHRLVEYLTSPPISVTKKKEAVGLDSGEVSYMFEISNHPDAAWLEIFDVNKDNAPVNMLGASMEIRCQSTAIQAVYAKVKAAIEQTNRTYDQMREQVLVEVTKLDEERQRASDVKEARGAEIDKQFDDLEL